MSPPASLDTPETSHRRQTMTAGSSLEILRFLHALASGRRAVYGGVGAWKRTPRPTLSVCVYAGVMFEHKSFCFCVVCMGRDNSSTQDEMLLENARTASVRGRAHSTGSIPQGSKGKERPGGQERAPPQRPVVAHHA